ncbi:hypothetical protein ABW19_dt0204404 [Dactylella cylindrospora]|nr:hypothetical protein ABW19_dt0204404 [Dactylella cylindrospora]
MTGSSETPLYINYCLSRSCMDPVGMLKRLFFSSFSMQAPLTRQDETSVLHSHVVIFRSLDEKLLVKQATLVGCLKTLGLYPYMHAIAISGVFSHFSSIELS